MTTSFQEIKDIYNKEIRNLNLYTPQKPFYTNRVISKFNIIGAYAKSIFISDATLLHILHNYLELEDAKCKICNNYVLYNRNTNMLNNCCSVPCSNKFREPLSNILSDEQIKKRTTNALFTKENKIIGGINVHKASAIKSAISRKHKQHYINNKISDVKNNNKLIKHKIKLSRIDMLIRYFGETRFFTLFHKLNKVKSVVTFNKLVYNILNKTTIDNIDSDIFYYEKCVGKNILFNCKLCGSLFTNCHIMSNIKFCNSNMFCSGKCAQQYSWNNDITRKMHMSAVSKDAWNNENYRNKQIIQLKNRKTYINFSAWSKKMLFTLTNTTKDGRTGLEIRRDNALITKINKGIITNITEQTPYKRYKQLVLKLTNHTDISNLDNFCNRGKHEYHLDHIFPISKGFIYKIPADLIANIDNLRFIPATENISKNNKITEIPYHIQEFINENKIVI